jgi:hypothetical protein
MRTLTIIFIATLLTNFSFGQSRLIKAKLIDAESGKPLTTGMVILFGTTTGAMTNQDGDFALSKIPTEQSEIIISDRDNNYLHLIVANIHLGKNKKEIDLGTIPMIKKTDPIELLSDQCLTLDGKKYKAKFVDGNYRYIPDTVAIIYMDKDVK